MDVLPELLLVGQIEEPEILVLVQLIFLTPRGERGTRWETLSHEKREKGVVGDMERQGRSRLRCAGNRAELSSIFKFPLPKPFDSSDLQMSRQILELAYTGSNIPCAWLGRRR